MLSIRSLARNLSLISNPINCVSAIKCKDGRLLQFHKCLTSSAHPCQHISLLKGSESDGPYLMGVKFGNNFRRHKSTRLPYRQVQEEDEEDVEEPESTEEMIQELSQCQDEIEVLGFLEKIGTRKLAKRALGHTTKILYHRLKRAESHSVHRTILNCVEKLYDPGRGMVHIKNLDSKTLLKLTEMLVILQVPPDFSVLKETLNCLSNILHHNVNHIKHLSLHQIIQLEYILQQLPDCPPTRAIHATLPNYFEKRLSSQMEPDDLHMLLNDLPTHDIDWNILLLDPDNVLQSVVNDFIDQRLSLDVYKAFNFFLLIADCCNVKLIQRSSELMAILFKTLRDNVEHLNSKEIGLLLKTCGHKVLADENVFYDPDFVKTLANKSVELTYHDYLDPVTINALSAMGHFDEDLLDTMTQTVVNNPDVLSDPETLSGLVHLYATCGYQPRKIGNFDFKTQIVKYSSKTMDLPQLNLALTLDLLTLNYFSEEKYFLDLLDKVFHSTNMQVYTLEEGDFDPPTPMTPLVYGASPLLLVIAAVRNFLGLKCQLKLPPVEVIQELERLVKARKWQYPLRQFLEGALGGSNYLTTGFWNQGIHIDHCVMVEEPEGRPAEMRDNFSLNDSLNKFPILIKVHPNWHYLGNGRRLRGMYQLESNILRNFGHPLIEIDLSLWDKMEAEGHKLTWIMDKIDECVKMKRQRKRL